jgi:hypothetical protein
MNWIINHATIMAASFTWKRVEKRPVQLTRAERGANLFL